MFKFDKETTDIFEDMLERSILQYDVMRETVEQIVRQNLEGATVLDIGCSKGGALENLVDYDATFYGIDSSKSMIEAFNKKFKNKNNVTGVYGDLRTVTFPYNTITLSISSCV